MEDANTTTKNRHGVVLSGGASLGAVQVGMMKALTEAHTPVDFFVGTSVGAINAAWMAGHHDATGVDGLVEIWRTLRRRDVFTTKLTRSALAIGGRRQSFFSDTGLRRLLQRHLNFEFLEEAPVPLHVVAVDVLSGRDVLLSSGPAIEAVMASAALPGFLPPVAIGNRWYMDGGVVNNAPLTYAAQLGASTVWVLPAGYPCALSKPPDSALAMALQGLSTLVQHRLALDALRWHDGIELRVVPPLCPITISPIDFSHSSELIELAYRSTSDWLSAGCPDVGASLYPHEHASSGARMDIAW